ncbi:MAG: lysine--tRNA ligase, partial [Candidatus Methanomethylophilaceae archaeon]|nr:lysine--tRNA ligase [Candidatus Methanomethylophilaceae archaeon]
PEVQLSDDEKKYFADLVSKLRGTDWKAMTINEVISETAKASSLGSKKGFQALYKILINRTAGPRLGAFLESMDKDFVIGRLTEASN